MSLTKQRKDKGGGHGGSHKSHFWNKDKTGHPLKYTVSILPKQRVNLKEEIRHIEDGVDKLTRNLLSRFIVTETILVEGKLCLHKLFFHPSDLYAPQHRGSKCTVPSCFMDLAGKKRTTYHFFSSANFPVICRLLRDNVPFRLHNNHIDYTVSKERDEELTSSGSPSISSGSE